MVQFKFSFEDVTADEIKVRTIEEAAKEKRSPVLEFIPQSKLFIYTKKKVKHPHVFLKWQMIWQVSQDYWPDNLKNAMVTC